MTSEEHYPYEWKYKRCEAGAPFKKTGSYYPYEAKFKENIEIVQRWKATEPQRIACIVVLTLGLFINIICVAQLQYAVNKMQQEKELTFDLPTEKEKIDLTIDPTPFKEWFFRPLEQQKNEVNNK